MTRYLIAHKVRGEPAFDVATCFECPRCGGPGMGGCDACDDGVFWTIPTSGHRAYPYWYTELADWDWFEECGAAEAISTAPDPWPDHYACNDRDHKPLPEGRSLKDILGNLFGPRPTINRRL